MVLVEAKERWKALEEVQGSPRHPLDFARNADQVECLTVRQDQKGQRIVLDQTKEVMSSDQFFDCLKCQGGRCGCPCLNTTCW